MAKPNYAFAKRQRDLAKKQKKEEKKLRKSGSATEGSEPTTYPADEAGVQAVASEPRIEQPTLAVEEPAPVGGDPVGGLRPEHP